MTLSLDRVVVFAAGIGFLSILLAGIFSDPYLADEVFHYRLASYIYELKAIPAYDPLVHTNPLTGKNYYVNAPLWHSTLALFWTITGQSQTSGQLFQALVYIGLVFVIFLLGKELYGLESGYYAALLVSSAPMVILYSILFHVDIFLILLCALCYLMIMRKRWFWVGVVLGLAFVAKRNSYLIAPAMAFCVLYYSEGQPKEKLKNLLVFLIALSVIVAPDLYRRHSTFGLYSVVKDNQPESIPVPVTPNNETLQPKTEHPEVATSSFDQKLEFTPPTKKRQPFVG
ncbi:MAG: ArnT family glycosyltransferase, partial [bacterium]